MTLEGLLTVVVLTKDEATALPGLIAHVPTGIRVVVIDCGSDDDTRSIAADGGCTVITNAWDGFAAQRNFALTSAAVTTPWVLFLDADERADPRLWTWIARRVAVAGGVDVFDLPSVLVHRGRPLRHAPGYPILHPRLVRPSVRFEANHEGHGEMPVAGVRREVAPVGYEHHYLHKGLSDWLDKHRRHADAAVEAGRTPQRAPTTQRGRLSAGFRPGVPRAFARFLYHYILRGGYRDGRPGLEFSLLYAWFELTKALYVRLGEVDAAEASAEPL